MQSADQVLDPVLGGKARGGMNFRLLSLRSTGPQTCEARFRMQPDQEELSAVFVVKDVDGIKLTTSEPDVFRRFDGSAEEQRQIRSAVIAFCEVGEQ
jgi:hypothetical protein